MSTQRTDMAARQFFGAFYKWSRLNAPAHSPHRCHVHTSTRSRSRTAAHSATTSTLHRHADQPATRPSNHFHINPRRRYLATDVAATADSAHTNVKSSKAGQREDDPESGGAEKVGNASSHDGLLSTIRTTTIETEATRPFEDIKSTEWVVRSRSSNQLVLEYALSPGIIDYLEHRFGPSAVKLSKVCGARMVIRQTPAKDGKMQDLRSVDPALQSVLISGDLNSVAVFVHEIECVASYFRRPVESEASTPTYCIPPFRWILRQRSAATMILETTIPESAWLSATSARSTLCSLAASTQADVRIGDIQRGLTRDGPPFRSIIVSGTPSVTLEACREMETSLSAIRDSALLNGKYTEPMNAKDAHPGSEASGQATVAEDVRAALRLLTHPVVVITTFDSAHDRMPASHDFGSCRGVTVSSFSTVTLQPSPIITFNLKVPSRSWDAMYTSRDIRVHIMAASSEGATIAHAFTQPYDQPGEPFQHLSQQGVAIQAQSSSFAPLIAPSHGVIAHINARILLSKCIAVGDHIVVVAEVLQCSILHEGHSRSAPELENALGPASGLSYAAKAYRAQGEQIRLLTTATDLAALQSAQQQTAGTSQGTSSALSNGRSAQFRDSSSGSLAKLATASVHSHARPASYVGLQPPRLRRHEFDQTPRASSRQTRSYSSTPIHSKDVVENASTNLKTILEPSARTTTVADFFNIPDEDNVPWRFHHIRRLLHAEKAAQQAARQLRVGRQNDAPLTNREQIKLQRTITVNERHVAKKLSMQAAKSLRLMLDKGRVNFKRAQWLESSIERGQAVLSEEKADLNIMLDHGLINEEIFREAAEEIQRQQDVLVTEAMRLRQIVDEESDGPFIEDDDE